MSISRRAAAPMMFAAALLLVLSGCAGTKTAGSSSGAAAAKPIDLGVYCGSDCRSALKLSAKQGSIDCKVAFLDDATSFPYGATQFQLAQQYAKEYFPKMQLKVLNGNNDASTQSSQLDTVVAQGYKTVILDPVVADALAPATKRAVAAGVKVVDIDRTVNTPVLTTIKAPDVPLGERAAQYIADQLHGNGTVAILSGTPGASPTIDRTTGFENVMKKYPGIQVVANINGDYDTNTSNTAVANLLTRFKQGKLDWIYSEGDAMSLGAIKALQASGRTDVKLSGIDGQEEALQAIQSGSYAADVVYPLVQPAAVVAAAKVCAGESLPKEIALDYPLVTTANVSKYLGTTFK